MTSDPTAPLPYTRQWLYPEDIQRAVRALESPYLTTGPEVSRFEASLCRLTGARHAIACASGTAALHLACLALEIQNQDTGLTSPISFLASANCIEYCGGRTDFIDISPETLCLDPAALADYCRNHPPPAVVIPVDFAGIPADLPDIRALSRQYGFAVIEDAAHAIGSTYCHQGITYSCGSCAHTDLAVFSFHPAKTITAGEGGAVMTGDDTLAATLRTLRSHGMVRDPDPVSGPREPWYYEMTRLGYNFRITDFQCALADAQLGHLAQFADRRRELVRRYNRIFESDPRLRIPPQALWETACPHLYPIQFTGGAEVRRRVYEFLRTAGIHCQVHYIPIYHQPYYRNAYGYLPGKCPHAEAYYAGTLSLPLFFGLTDAQADDIAHRVLSCV